MNPHWPSPVVAWILAAWTLAVTVGVVAVWWKGRPTRDRRLQEDIQAWKAQQR